ncbi:MAG TPA: helix-turn-helix domain-containing protein [Vicinamibacterales bacterium]|nr:helix-turn-helix domain-containing protein [Vicinamibacterales bacterium]
MRYTQYPPSPALARIADCYWILEDHGTGRPEPIIPDGRMEIVLHYGVRFERHHPNGSVERQPASLIVGQMLAPMCLGYRGAAGVAAIRLRPAGARSVLRGHAAEITNRAVDLEAIFGSTATLRERLALAADDAARVRVLEGWLASIVRGGPAAEIDAAVGAIALSGGTAALTGVAADAGLSLRQLERRFLTDVGLPPKSFARLVRLQAALRRIGEGRPLAEIAQACGYYDQSHMTRDFGRLAETSPAAWLQGAGDLTQLFVGR